MKDKRAKGVVYMQIVNKKITDIRPYEKNPRKNDEAVKYVAESIKEFGFKVPIIIDKDNVIVCGHTRYKAAKQLKIKEVPCVLADDLTDEQIKAFRLADNKVSEKSLWDYDLLAEELSAINDLDMSLFDFTIDELTKETEEEQKEEARRKLNDYFIVPPFSVLDTRSGVWQERKSAWNVLIGNASETRDDDSQKTFDTPDYMPQINGQTSNFDPVLAETMMLWFNKPGGKILDPFGGEQTKGVVAGEMKFPYFGCEIRQEQVDVNNERTKEYDNVTYFCGDSNNISEIIKEREFDMCFTSPPYYDLEVYSQEDMSALGTYEEFMEQYKNIFSQCYDMMAENSFLVVKVTEIRDKKTGIYRNFVPDNIRVMEEIGFKYYNEIILVNVAATAAFTAVRKMRNRKVGRTHQNVLVFYKGDLERLHDNVLVFYKGDQKDIAKHFPELQPGLIEVEGLDELIQISK